MELVAAKSVNTARAPQVTGADEDDERAPYVPSSLVRRARVCGGAVMLELATDPGAEVRAALRHCGLRFARDVRAWMAPDTPQRRAELVALGVELELEVERASRVPAAADAQAQACDGGARNGPDIEAEWATRVSRMPWEMRRAVRAVLLAADPLRRGAWMRARWAWREGVPHARAGDELDEALMRADIVTRRGHGPAVVVHSPRAATDHGQGSFAGTGG